MLSMFESGDVVEVLFEYRGNGPLPYHTSDDEPPPYKLHSIVSSGYLRIAFP